MDCDDCKYKNICNLPPEKRKDCKAYSKEEPLIFGHTWEQIQAMQQRKKIST